MSQSTKLASSSVMPAKRMALLGHLLNRVRFPFYKQLDAMDCGPACLRMIAQYYGQTYSLQFLRQKSFLGREGVSLLGLSDAAESIGLRSLAVRIPAEKLDQVPLPCIAHWRQNHFVVIYKIRGKKVYVADPAHGLLTYTRREFSRGWISTRQNEGVLLLLESTPVFYRRAESQSDKSGFKFLYSYLFVHKRALIQLALLMLLGSFIQMVFPFLTQAIVDTGIGNRDLGVVNIVLIAQLTLYASRTVADFMRSRILLRMGTRLNISIISDFLAKLMRLPLSFFDSKMIGDILQRINDHHRIETFLTSTTLSILFSIVNLVTFSLVLAIYNRTIFAIFLLGSLIYAIWILFFMQKRRELDYKRFSQLSDNQSTLIQLIRGMPEIKLNTSEKQKRWEWQQIQEKLFQINLDSLALGQYQQGGALFISQLKDIFIVFFVAQKVISGHMTLGMMMSIQYIIGQLNGPITQILGFIRAAQDAKISLERLGEVHNQQDEEEWGKKRISIFPRNKNLYLDRLNFQYEGPHSEYVLKDLTMRIPAGKVTAIVGPSGSGKTTLLKLLLKFYAPTCGEIRLGEVALADLDSRVWRRKCGVVMQDGYVFSDTIAENIALADEEIDEHKLLKAVETANIKTFVESLPLGFNTKIGLDGHDLSRGQKQRILIARAVYKNPEYLFFDEATNALDANNEKIIMHNLEDFFAGRTVLIIAHRLSTVKKADQIVVLDGGCIVEQGDHTELTALRGAYYHLVKNQLELGA